MMMGPAPMIRMLLMSLRFGMFSAALYLFVAAHRAPPLLLLKLKVME